MTFRDWEDQNKSFENQTKELWSLNANFGMIQANHEEKSMDENQDFHSPQNTDQVAFLK